MKASQKTTTKEPSLNKKYGFVIMQLSAKNVSDHIFAGQY